ncbi:Gamma-aminobutyric acid type B receptor subunit 1 [Geranomyces variabilis]|nr:Gamma-aminobutyric acid type B receptor subunit 1 [Geranomyces variabilis]
MIDAMALRRDQLLDPTATNPVHPALLTPGAVTLTVVDSSSSGNHTANVASAISSALKLGGGIIATTGNSGSGTQTKIHANSLIGVAYSDPTEAFVSAALAYALPVCDGGSTSPVLSNRADYPNFFRVIPNDNKAALAILGLVAGFGWQKIAITSSSDSYGSGLLTSALSYASDYGITVLTSQTFSQGTTDFRSIIDRIVESQATIILHLGFARDLGMILEAAYNRGLAATGAYQWVTGDDASYIDMSTYTAAQRAMWSGVWMVYPREGVGPAWDAYSANFLARYINVPHRAAWYSGRETEPPPYSGFYAACVEAYIWAWDAALRYGNATMPQLAANNYTLTVPQAYNFSDRVGVTGNLTLDEDGDRVATYGVWFYNVSDGLAGAYHKFGTYETASRVLSVDEAPAFYTGKMTPVVYDTLQVVKSYQEVKWASVLGGLTVVVTLALATAILCLAAIVIKHRRHDLFKPASPPFLLTNLAGLLCGTVYPLALLGQPSRASCVTTVVLAAAAISLTLGSLLVKIFRLFWILRRQGTRSRHIPLSTLSMFRLLAIGSSYYVVSIIVWNVFDPPHPVWTIQGKEALDYEVYQSKCRSSSDAMQNTMQAVILGYTGVLGCLGAFFAYVTRNLPAKFRESKPLAHVIFGNLLLICGTLPLLYFVPLPFNAAHVIKCFAAYAAVITTACVVYAERCRALWGQLHESRRDLHENPANKKRRKTSMDELMPDALRPATKSGHVYVAERQSFVSVWTQRTLILHSDKGFALISGDHISDGLLECRYIPLDQFTISTSTDFAEEVFTLSLVHVDDWVASITMRVLTQEELESWAEAMSQSCSAPAQGAPPATLYTCDM